MKTKPPAFTPPVPKPAAPGPLAQQQSDFTAEGSPAPGRVAGDAPAKPARPGKKARPAPVPR